MKAVNQTLAMVTDERSDSWKPVPIKDIADINPKLDKSAIPDKLMVSFVPMQSVGAGDGSIDVSNLRPASEVKKGFTNFQEGDVLFAKITPCMENGKMAVVPKVASGYGFGSTEFHVLRPKNGLDPRYLYYFVSSQNVRKEAAHNMTGAVGQKRVSTSYIADLEILLAPPDQQRLIVAESEKQFSRLDQSQARQGKHQTL
jgi:type I restriction enzyme S subunit